MSTERDTDADVCNNVDADVENDADCDCVGILPATRVATMLKANMAAKRASQGSAIYAAGFIEYLFTTLIDAADADANASETQSEGGEAKRKRVNRLALVRAVRSDPTLSKLFSTFSFVSSERVAYDGRLLLTKDDREKRKRALTALKDTASKDRGASNNARIPAVDEE